MLKSFTQVVHVIDQYHSLVPKIFSNQIIFTQSSLYFYIFNLMHLLALVLFKSICEKICTPLLNEVYLLSFGTFKQTSRNQQTFYEQSPIYSRQLMYTVIIQISNNFKVQLDLYDPFSVEQALRCVSKQLYARILAGLSIRALKC